MIGSPLQSSGAQSSRTRPGSGSAARGPRASDETSLTSAALVPVTPPDAVEKTASLGRPNPAFVTHLIAMAQQAPQTRTLRRASPEEAQALYRAQPASAAASGVRTSKII